MKNKFLHNSIFLVVVAVPSLSMSAPVKKIAAVVVSASDAFAKVGNNKFRSIRRRSKLYSGEIIKTGNSGLVNIKFLDGALLKLRKNSMINLAQYRYSPVRHAGKLKINLGSNSNLLFISGKMKKNNIRFKSHVGIVGVRGTVLDEDQTTTCKGQPKGQPCLFNSPNSDYKFDVAVPKGNAFMRLNSGKVESIPEGTLGSYNKYGISIRQPIDKNAKRELEGESVILKQETSGVIVEFKVNGEDVSVDFSKSNKSLYTEGYFAGASPETQGVLNALLDSLDEIKDSMSEEELQVELGAILGAMGGGEGGEPG